MKQITIHHEETEFIWNARSIQLPKINVLHINILKKINMMISLDADKAKINK